MRSLEILGAESGVLGDSSGHLGANFVSVMKCENENRPDFAAESAMRPGLRLDLPPDDEQRRKRAASVRRRPLAHGIAANVAAASGNPALHREHFDKATEQVAALADAEERAILEATLRVIPIPGR